MGTPHSKSKIITVSLLLKDIRNDTTFYNVPSNSTDQNIRDLILKKYQTDIGIMEGFVDSERLIVQWYPDEVIEKAEALHHEAIDHMKKKQPDKALQKWQKALNYSSEDVDYLYRLGLTLFEQNKYADALKYLDKCVRICPIHYRAHLLAGIAWLKLRKFERAEKHVLESNRLNRSNVLTYLNLGAIYSTQKRYNEAIEMFNTTIELSPNESRAYLGLAKIYNMLNDVDAANSYFKKVIEIAPDSSMAEYAQKSMQAQEEEIVAEDPDNTDASTIEHKKDQISKGMGSYLSGEYSSSSDKYKEYLNLHPSDDYAWYLLGETKLRSGELSESADCFKRAVRLNATKGLYYKALAIVFHYLSKSDEVLEYLKKAMELGKEDVLCWTLQGIHLSLKDKIEPAINALNVALKKNPNNPLALYHLALAQVNSNQIAKAVDTLEKINKFEYLVPIKSQAKKLHQSISISE